MRSQMFLYIKNIIRNLSDNASCGKRSPNGHKRGAEMKLVKIEDVRVGQVRKNHDDIIIICIKQDRRIFSNSLVYKK